MVTRTVSLYPTPENCQLQDAGPHGVRQINDYLSSLVKGKTLSEVASVKVYGFAGVRLTIDEELSALQVAEERLATAEAEIRRLLGTGELSGALADHLLAALVWSK